MQLFINFYEFLPESLIETEKKKKQFKKFFTCTLSLQNP